MIAVSKAKSAPLPIKASFWFLICAFMQKGISVITTPIYTRLMSTEDYGQYNVFSSWEGIFAVFISLNLAAGMFAQGLVKYENDRNKFISSMQGLSLALVALGLLFYLPLNSFFNRITGLNTTYSVIMLICIWLNSVFAFWAGEQRVDYKYKKLVAVTLINSILTPVLSIILILLLEDNVLARIIAILASSIISFLWIFPHHLKRGGLFFSKKYWKSALLFSIPLIPHYLSQTVLNSSDKIMIEKMSGASAAGIYSLAYSLSLMMTLFNTALMSTVSPWIYKKIKNKQFKDIHKIAYPTLIGIAGVNILLILFAPEIVRIFAPAEYYEAIWIVPPVAMSAFFMYAYDLFAKFEFYFEKTKWIAFATSAGAILNIALNFIFINKFGYIAAGYTTLTCYILYALLHYFFMRKVCIEHCDNAQPFSLRTLGGITFVFLIAGFAILATYGNPIIRYILIAIALLGVIIFRKTIISYIKDSLFMTKGKEIKNE